MITNQPSSVTVIGLGLMGQALAGAFLKDGHRTTVWNRTASKAESLVAQGAKLAGSVREAVGASPLVVVCVSNYDQVRELLDPLDDVLKGKVLVNLTSGTSQLARETAEWARKRDVTYFDGAIMSIPQGIGTEVAVIFYSGPHKAFEVHEATLKSLAEASTYLGEDHGLSSLYDVALLGVMWAIGNAFIQGAALVGTAGVEAATFAPFAAQVAGTVGSWLPGYGKQIDDGTYPADDAALETHLITMDNLIHESEAVGVSAELPKYFKAVANRAIAEGHGSEGYAVLIEQFRKPSVEGK
jgi:3-hydroxyisobutyrate dehydrogenase-like beta-hydroxyacid dehydrogenase